MVENVPTLLEKVQGTLRLKHYSSKTEESSVYWIRQFVRFYHMRHPRELGGDDRKTFHTSLAVEQDVSAST